MLTLLLFLLIFSVLVLVHEFGHFIVARKCGIRVHEFGIGLPPRAITIWTDKRGTAYTLNWIPFGAFVKLLGENDPAEDRPQTPSLSSTEPTPNATEGIEDIKRQKNHWTETKRKESQADPVYRIRDTQYSSSDPGSFSIHPLWQRMAVVVAGVGMNFVLAVVLLTIVFATSFTPLAVVPEGTLPFPSYLVQTEREARNLGIVRTVEKPDGIPIERIESGSAAEKTGLRTGDRIFALDAIRVLSGSQLSTLLAERRGQTVILTVHQEGQERIVVDLPADRPFGIFIDSGTVIRPVRFAPHVALYRAAGETVKQSILAVVLLKNVIAQSFTERSIPEGVSGPVGIFHMTGEVSKGGVTPTLLFAAMLSISLGVMNILPIPALDGGRLLFLLYELIARRRPNQKAETAIHAAGFALLILFIVAVTWKDIGKIVGG